MMITRNMNNKSGTGGSYGQRDHQLGWRGQTCSFTPAIGEKRQPQLCSFRFLYSIPYNKLLFINYRKELVWCGKTRGRQRLPRADGLVISLEVPKLWRSTQSEIRLQKPWHITSHTLPCSNCPSFKEAKAALLLLPEGLGLSGFSL